jgi:hypothetical protein
MNGCVFDMVNMKMLKLSDENFIMRAYYGFKPLTEEEIVELYGTERIYSPFTYEKYRNPPVYLAFHSYFDCPILLMLQKILDLHRRDLIKKTAMEMYEDVTTCVIKNYVHYDDKKCYDLKEFGHFFPTIVANPDLFIEK